MRDGVKASLYGSFVLDIDARRVDVESLVLSALRTSWRLASTPTADRWTDTGVNVAALDLVDAGTGQQHLTASGTWREWPGRAAAHRQAGRD